MDPSNGIKKCKLCYAALLCKLASIISLVPRLSKHGRERRVKGGFKLSGGGEKRGRHLSPPPLSPPRLSLPCFESLGTRLVNYTLK